MSKKFLVALAVMAAIITFLVLYLFYAGGPPFKGQEKPQAPAAKSQTAPEPAAKPEPGPAPVSAPAPGPTPAPAPAPAPTTAPAPGPAPPASPAPPEKPQILTLQPIPPPEKPVTKPEAAQPQPPETVLPPLEPKEEYGLLAGSYRQYAAAAKKMEQLEKQGQPAFIRKDKGKYQVWVGPFASHKEAAATAKALKGKRKSPPKIQKIMIPVPK